MKNISTWQNMTSLRIPLGDGQQSAPPPPGRVIAGWDRGLVGICAGEKVTTDYYTNSSTFYSRLFLFVTSCHFDLLLL